VLTFPNAPEANVPPGVPVHTARPVSPVVAEHGEGPVWHPSFGGVRWVDMHAGDILELVGTDDVRRHHVGTVAAAFRPRRGGGTVVADQRGFALLDADLQVERRLPDVWDDPDVRMNEGGADPAGNFWCGSMAYDERTGAGALYRLAPDLSVEKVLDGLTISNGLGFSPDATRAYYVDTPTRRVDVLDHHGGVLTGRRPGFPIAEARASRTG
jgi:sugar lactone lactonase YvrE